MVGLSKSFHRDHRTHDAAYYARPVCFPITWLGGPPNYLTRGPTTDGTTATAPARFKLTRERFFTKPPVSNLVSRHQKTSVPPL